MRLQQLHQYLGELLAAGTNPETIVCVAAEDSQELFEISQCDLVTGTYREDPAPKMPAPLVREGAVLLLKGVGVDYSALDSTHLIGDLPVESPEKTWPNGWDK